MVNEPFRIEKRQFTCTGCSYSSQVFGGKYFDYGCYNYIETFQCESCNSLYEGVTTKREWEGYGELGFLPSESEDRQCLACGKSDNPLWDKNESKCPKCSGLMIPEVIGEIHYKHHEESRKKELARDHDNEFDLIEVKAPERTTRVIEEDTPPLEKETLVKYLKRRFKRVHPIEFLDERPKFFLDHICMMYPLSDDLINKYKDILNWDLLTDNEEVGWTFEMMERFKSYWSLGYNDEKLGSRAYYDKLFNLKPELIFQFKDKVDYEGLSQNTELLKLYPEILNEFKEHLFWDYISGNEYLQWTPEVIDEFEEYLNWEIISGNRAVNWSDSLLTKYADRINYERLEHGNHEQWLNYKRDDSYSLRDNNDEYVPPMERPKYSDNELSKMIKNGDWERMSWDPQIPWTEKLIDKYIDKWKWGHRASLISEGVSEEDLEEGTSIAEYYSGLSYNCGLPWSEKLIIKYYDRIFWQDLSINEGVPWSIEILERFERNWFWEHLSQNMKLWEKVFYPHLDDMSISEILERIKHKILVNEQGD